MNKILHQLKGFFSNNWVLKLFSMVLAVLSFVAIRSATSFEVPYDIPIKVEVEEKKGVAILDQQPLSARVTFRGSREDLRRLEQERIKVAVKATAESVMGEENIIISPRNVTGFSGVMVAKIRPHVVRIKYDSETEKTFRVAPPETEGQPGRGKVQITYTPKEVKIRGSKSRLEELVARGENLVETAKVDVDGIEDSFTTRVRVLQPPDTWVAKIKPSEIRVKIQIVTEKATRGITNVTVLAIMQQDRAANVSFEPETVNITLTGQKEVLDGIKEQQVKAFVDCTDIIMSVTNELPVNIHLPAEIEASVLVEPRTVKVRHYEPTATKNSTATGKEQTGNGGKEGN